ncbi:MAG: protein-glutamate O-methyltransferase CheR [Sphingomonadales bacterium]
MTERPASPAAIRVLSALIEARTGQQLSAARSWRIESSLKPVLRETGLASLDLLVGQIVSGRNDGLASTVIDALLNNETSFFRDAAVFEQLDRNALEALQTCRTDTRRLRIWSAACSTGQEAYSLAMMLRDGGARWAGWTFDIFASDVSGAAVARARRGRFSRFEIQRGLPVRKMLNWFREDGDEWVADPFLSRDIRFAVHDIRQPAPGVFDLILCRNVLMYFPVPVRTKVFGRLSEALAPDGLLILGAGETVIGQTDRFASDPDMRGVYRPTPETSLSPLRVASR